MKMEETTIKTEEENTENTFNDGNEEVGTDKGGMMPAKKSVHIIKRGERWAIKKQGASRATQLYDNKEEAILDGREFRELGYDLVIHRKDGKIQRHEKAKTQRTIKTPKVKGKIPRRDIERAVKKAMSKR